MTLIACGTTRHLRLESGLCETCGFVTVQLVSYGDSAYWSTDRACTSCGDQNDDGPLVPASEMLDEQMARMDEICARADRACECPMVFWEGELADGMMYAPCAHELARGMSVEMASFLIREVGGIVRVGIGLERERRGPVFDALPVGTVLDDYSAAGEPAITMAAMKNRDGTWETDGALGKLEVRNAFMYGRIKLKGCR